MLFFFFCYSIWSLFYLGGVRRETGSVDGIMLVKVIVFVFLATVTMVFFIYIVILVMVLPAGGGGGGSGCIDVSALPL